MKWWCIISTLLCVASGYSQEDDLIILTEFTTTVTEDRVGVSFTLAKGSFCYGAQLRRAVDTLDEANFKQIGEIAGVCGSQDFEATYTLWDENPVPNRKVYYRMVTGFIPTGFLPVTFNDFGVSGHRLGPNPWREETRISLSNQELKPVSVEIYRTTGQLVLARQLGRASEVVLPRGNLTSGIYVYRVFVNEVYVGSGKMILQ